MFCFMLDILLQLSKEHFEAQIKFRSSYAESQYNVHDLASHRHYAIFILFSLLVGSF